MALRSTRRAARPAPSVPDLDPVVHQRVRLGILSALAAGGTTAFTDLKTVLDLTDGNLSVHARKLEEAGYLTVTKTFADRTPLTESVRASRFIFRQSHRRQSDGTSAFLHPVPTRRGWVKMDALAYS